MKEMHGGSSRDDRLKREQLREEKEMAKFAQLYLSNSFLFYFLWKCFLSFVIILNDYCCNQVVVLMIIGIILVQMLINNGSSSSKNNLEALKMLVQCAIPLLVL